MKTLIRRLVPVNTLFRNLLASVVFITVFIAILYVLINSPA